MEKNEVHKEIKETLNSLDGLQKAEPPQHLYERVMMRLESKQAKVISLAPRVVWQAAACITLLIVLNVMVCMRFSKSHNKQTQASKNPVAEEYFSYLRTTQF